MLAVLFVLLAIDFPDLGADPWQFAPGHVSTGGTLGWVVRLAHSRWDVGVLRAGAVLAMACVAVCWLVRAATRAPWPRAVLVTIALLAATAVVVPGVVMQVALREGTAPWYYTNDSTYQIELAGDLTRHGHTPYGHDYSGTGMARFYSFNGTVPRHRPAQPALTHFAYFPGSAVVAAAWTALPWPWDDYRFVDALATVLLIPASLLFRGPFGFRLAIGTVLACNPVVVRLAWFGNADAPCLLGLVLAFGLAARGRIRSAAAALAIAILMKQFAIAAVPFFLILVGQRGRRADVKAAVITGSAVLAAGFLPFVAASPIAVWRDTITYGASTYRIVSYGVSGVLVRLGVVGRHSTSYPFLPLMLIVWLPITALAARIQWRRREAWLAGAGFTLSVFVMIALGRVFQESYIVYPITGVCISALLALPQAAEMRAAVS